MFRRSPLLLLLLAAAAVPVACSDDGQTTDAGTGGRLNGSGGSELSIDGSGGNSTASGGSGEGGVASGVDKACASFIGLEKCGSDQLKSEVTPVNILLVLDKSGSMEDVPKGGTASLWDATTQALTNALEKANDAVSFGLQLFPERGATQCEMPAGADLTVPVGTGMEARDKIVLELDRTKPGGGTPTADALRRAFNYFNSGEGADLKGDRFVLLATDGGPNCNADATCEAQECTINIDGNCSDTVTNCCTGSAGATGCLDEQRTLEVIQDLRDIDVDTFVVGLAGTEEYAAQLDAFADAGGRARSGTAEKYFKVAATGTATGLLDVLNEITTDLVQTCNLQLTAEPEAIDKINVAVDCQVINNTAPPSAGLGGQGGAVSASDSYWWLDQETSPPTVRLGGTICEQIENHGVERIDIITGCSTLR